MQYPILHELNLKLGANVVDFHGWQMPIFYSSILNEYHAVRERAGIFDVSHMGRFLFTGAAALPFLDYLTTNNLFKLKDGKALYTCLLNEDAGIIDDLIIYKFNSEKFLVINNAGNHQAVSNWFAKKVSELKEDIKLNIDTAQVFYEDLTVKLAQIAVQGPLAKSLVNKYLGLSEDIPYFSFKSIELKNTANELLSSFNEEIIISATGYTGEAGYELYASPEILRTIVSALLEYEDVNLAGLGARDVLRLEAGYCLHGNDISLDTTPYEASLDWVVKLDKNFIGKSRATARTKFLRGLLFPVGERVLPRAATKLYGVDDKEIGYITSGTFSFVLNRGIALAYLCDLDLIQSIMSTEDLKTVSMKVRKDVFSASIIEPWFYRNIIKREINNSSENR